MALINFGMLDTRVPAEMGAAPANMLAQIRQQRAQDEDRAFQREGMQMQNALARMKIEGAQAESARVSRRNNVLSGVSPDRVEDAVPELMKVDPEYALEFQGKLDDRKEKRVKLGREEIETSLKKLDYSKQVLGTLMQNPTDDAVIGAFQDLSRVAGTPPEEVERKTREILSLPPAGRREYLMFYASKTDEAIKMLTPQLELVDFGGSKQFVQKNPYAGEVGPQGGSFQKTMSPGEIAADARARATLAQSERHFQATQGLQRDRLELDRSKIKAEHGTPSTPKLTEGQAKAQLFGSRAAEADRIITDLEEKVSPIGLALQRGAEGVWGVGGALGAVGNSMLSPEAQQLGQAKRDFINAVLRLESGATIQEEEFNNAEKQYFPQPGDSKAVIEQKRRNRQTAIQGLGVMAGPAGGRVQPQSAPAATEQTRNIVVDW